MDDDGHIAPQKLFYPKKICVDYAAHLLKSEAFHEPTGKAHVVYWHFLGKRRWAKRGGGKPKFVNNGEITFPYSEANSYGISDRQFKHAITQLVHYGLIDITHSGQGVCKDQTRYGISERWKKWGTDEFISKERPVRHRRRNPGGFSLGHVPTNKKAQ